MGLLFKIWGWVFGILCLVSAVLQYNDPDPVLWMAIYGVVALISFAFSLNKLPLMVPLVLGVLGLVAFFYIFPEKFEGFAIGGGDIKNIEEGREAFGLLILSSVMLLYALRIHWTRRS